MSLHAQVEQGFNAFWKRRGFSLARSQVMGERLPVSTVKPAEADLRDESCPMFATKADRRPLAEREAAEKHRRKAAAYYRANHEKCLARQRAYHARMKLQRTPEQKAAMRKYARDYYQKNRAWIRPKQNALTPEQRAAKAARGKRYYQANKAAIAQQRRDRKDRRRAAL